MTESKTARFLKNLSLLFGPYNTPQCSKRTQKTEKENLIWHTSILSQETIFAALPFSSVSAGDFCPIPKWDLNGSTPGWGRCRETLRSERTKFSSSPSSQTACTSPDCPALTLQRRDAGLAHRAPRRRRRASRRRRRRHQHPPPLDPQQAARETARDATRPGAGRGTQFVLLLSCVTNSWILSFLFRRECRSTGALVGRIVGVVLVGILVIVVLVFLYRYKCKKEMNRRVIGGTCFTSDSAVRLATRCTTMRCCSSFTVL